jgi:NAD(P)-dependent dehydrogenase (short-subunit alcohol dehydrogenase family)
MQWQGKTALITGAGSGFGLELARRAAAQGMRLVLLDVQRDALEQAAAEQQAAGAQVLPFCLSVADAPAMQAMAEAVQRQWGAPHLLFNNAGVGAGGLIWENSLDDWQWVLGVNLMGVVHGIRLFTPMMLEAARTDPAWRGHIVNTASMAGLVNPPNMGVYNVSKHAVVSLTETLHHDLQLVTAQIGVSVLCPFFVATGISRSERNRPGFSGAMTASQRVGAAMIDKAVRAGKVSAAEVAAKTFEAIAERQFYIYSHPQALASVRERMRDVVEGRQPADPFAGRGDIREQLQTALQSGGQASS